MTLKKILGIATIVGIILTMFFLISNDAVYLDPTPKIQVLFEKLFWVFLGFTIAAGFVWFKIDGRK